jgi:hypothetical protein
MSKSQMQKRKGTHRKCCRSSENPKNLLLSDTNYFNGMDDCPTWNDIYRMFVNEDFSKDDEDLVVYRI